MRRTYKLSARTLDRDRRNRQQGDSRKPHVTGAWKSKIPRERARWGVLMVFRAARTGSVQQRSRRLYLDTVASHWPVWRDTFKASPAKSGQVTPRACPMRGQDLNLRPLGYEPSELPTAPPRARSVPANNNAQVISLGVGATHSLDWAAPVFRAPGLLGGGLFSPRVLRIGLV